MKELWSQHRRLIKAGIILAVIVVVWGAIEVISIVQYNNRQKTMSPVITMEERTEEFKAYDVTGLEQEEIDTALEKQRESEKSQEE